MLISNKILFQQSRLTTLPDSFLFTKSLGQVLV